MIPITPLPSFDFRLPNGHHAIIAGPTASGKSSLVLRSAQRWGHTVVNADSMQMYRGLPLLTAVPSAQDQAQVPHTLYEHLEPSAPRWSAMSWRQHVQGLLETSSTPLWIVGGTGFYLQALTDGLSPVPAIDSMTKDLFRARYTDYPAAELRQALYHHDPVAAQRLQDPQRLVYALMVAQVTGKPLSFWQSLPRTPLPYTFSRILVWPGLDALMAHALQRWHQMVRLGVIDEIRRFCASMDWRTSPLQSAIGFRAVRDWALGVIDQDTCTDLYMRDIRAYIKRQRTWFRSQFAQNHPGHLTIIPQIFNRH